MNYGEELAFLYFRLNGFFLVENFVIHRGDGEAQNADIDLLAVRFPHVYEHVGGRDVDWHEHLQACVPITDCRVGAIVQVKTGKVNFRTNTPFGRGEELGFSEERLRKAIGRFGFVRPHKVHEAAKQLLDKPWIQLTPTTRVAKFVVCQQRPTQGPWFCLELSDVEAFIQNRMARYANEKEAARLFFPSVLAQYFAWKGGVYRQP